MRKLFTLLLAIVASVSMAFSEIYSGTCGNGLNWSVDTKTGVLNISGEGTYNYSPYGYTPEEPWNSYKSQISILKLGAGVQSISPYYFYRCGLDSIFVDSENPSYVAQDSVLFNKNKTTLVLYARNHRGSYEVPSGVTAIGDYAFYGSLLSEVILQGSVTTLGTYAFAGMSYLTNVVLSEGLTRIGDHCFYFSNYLKTINIPNSLTYVGDYAFIASQSKIAAPLYNDRLFVFMPPLSMSSYSIPEGIQEICAHAFYDNYILSEILLPKS